MELTSPGCDQPLKSFLWLFLLMYLGSAHTEGYATHNEKEQLHTRMDLPDTTWWERRQTQSTPSTEHVYQAQNCPRQSMVLEAKVTGVGVGGQW